MPLTLVLAIHPPLRLYNKWPRTAIRLSAKLVNKQFEVDQSPAQIKSLAVSAEKNFVAMRYYKQADNTAEMTRLRADVAALIERQKTLGNILGRICQFNNKDGMAQKAWETVKPAGPTLKQGAG